jgi:hypothetical protein
MKKIFPVMLVAIMFLAANLAFSQSVSLNPNGVPIKTIMDFGVNCSGGQIHDDGVAENGYGWNASAGNPSAWCMKFIPTVYPYKFSKFCVGLTRLSTGVASFTFTITMWKSVNGAPTVPFNTVFMDTVTVTATAVPVWPAVTFYDFVLPSTWAQVTAPDSVYIGIKYNPVTMTGVFVASDESPATPLWPGYCTVAAGPWTTIISNATFALCRSLLFRTEGGSAVSFTHDYSVPNYLSLPTEWVKNTLYNVKAKVQNFGTSAETNVPIKFFVNGVLTGTPINKSLAAGGVDSVSFPWTPLTAGAYTLKIASALTTDEYKGNDTATTNITVNASALQTFFCDPFTTAGNWTLTTNGGTVPWALATSFATPNIYTLPSTAVPPALACDVDAAGSGNSSNAVATLTTSINCTGKTGVYLTFDHDWYALSTTDIAKTEMSTDGGATWTELASWNTSHRSATETIQMPTAENKAAVKIRFTAIQPSWDWWWIVDNVCLKGYLMTDIGNSGTLPTDYSLSQNYPNPFNPVTQINYSVKTNGFVTLKVYDLLGKEVSTLVNEVKNPGYYTVDFNAAALSSGVYFYRIDVNGFSNIKRMMLIK